MYVYERTVRNLWTVGHYKPNEDGLGSKWWPESDHETSEAAAARVHYLNGGKRERGRKVRWTEGASEDHIEHVGWMVELVPVSDATGLSRPCMVIERADGSVTLAWIVFNQIRFVG